MRTSFSKLSLLTLPIFALTACQDYEPFTEAEVHATMVARNFKNEFEQKIGVIDPAHTWGFGLAPASERTATRSSNDNRNEWESYYHLVVPGNLEQNDSAPWGWTTGDITQYERAYVYWWFSTHKNPVSLHVNWSDYFIQHVWGQPEHGLFYADGAPYSSDLGMDKLMVYEPNNPNPTSDQDGYEDYRDFNKAGGAKEQMVRQEYSSTLNFQYNSSTSTAPDKGQYGRDAEHVIVCINGNYYLAFDYHAVTPNRTGSGGVDRVGNIELDGYYNDWILKLTPGRRIETDGYTRRIMCEDLSAFDFDFNDVVFDVTFLCEDNSTGLGTAVITLQAAGGTLPIYIGQVSDEYEAHGMFGVDTSVPVNVKDGMTKRPAVIFYYPQKVYGVKEGDKWLFDPNTIPVYVQSADNAVEKLEVKIGGAPQKFACANNLHWSQELTPIYEFGYVNFKQWAGNDNQYKDTWYNPADHDYLYGDNGAAYTFQQSYMPNENWDIAEVKEWKWLFDHRADAVTWNGDATKAAAAQLVFTTLVDNNHQTFESQKPFIFVDPNDASEDLEVRSPIIMDAILSSNQYNIYENMKVVRDWSTMAQEPLQTYTISVDVANGVGGTVSGGGIYERGKEIQLTATPDPYFRFVGWSDRNSDNPRTIIVNASQTYTAYFERTYEEFTNTIGTVTELGNNATLIDADQPAGEYLFVISANNSGSFGFNAQPYSVYIQSAGTTYVVVTKQANQAVLVNSNPCVTSVTVKSKNN